jgi:uncharacterized protein
MSNIPNDPRVLTFPGKIIVSLRVGLVLAAANILCVAIIAGAWVHTHVESKEINVTGSAKKQLESDLIVWSATVSSSDTQLVDAYTQLQTGTAKVLAFLDDQGIPKSQITVGSVATTKHQAKDDKGHDTEKVAAYELSQQIAITSNDIYKTSTVANNITSLIKEGVMVESAPPKFIYTKLADLKIAMLADATKDATARAQQIAVNSGAKLGSIIDARMGVMQINPVNSSEVSDSGNNDTTSRVKEITAVVTARFALQ